MFIVTSALAATGLDVNALTLSKTSHQKFARQSTGRKMKEAFDPRISLVLYFDNKMLPGRDEGLCDVLLL